MVVWDGEAQKGGHGRVTGDNITFGEGSPVVIRYRGTPIVESRASCRPLSPRWTLGYLMTNGSTLNPAI